MTMPRIFPAPCLLLMAQLLCSASAPAQSWTWTQVGSGSSGEALAYDSVRHRVVTFSGGTTWEWEGTAWLQLPLRGPQNRTGFSLTYDAARQVTVLFGGRDNYGNLADTWEYNGFSWVPRLSAHYPPPRVFGATAYDSASGLTVLFGGGDYSNGYFADTWLWNGADWLQASPATSPTARQQASMAYDQSRQRAVLVGGNNSLGAISDLWEWDGGAWTQAAASLPVAPPTAVASYNSALSRVVVFGSQGCSQTPACDVALEWDGLSWTSENSYVYNGQYNQPVQRAVHDTFRGRTFCTGSNGALYYGLGTPLAAATTTFGVGCRGLWFGADQYSRPELGETMSCTISSSNAIFTNAFVAIGASQSFYGPFRLPLVLDGFGMWNCNLYQDCAFGTGWPCSQPGQSSNTASFQLAVPADPALVGVVLYLQAWAVAPTANAIGIITSNALQATVGDI